MLLSEESKQLEQDLNQIIEINSIVDDMNYISDILYESFSEEGKQRYMKIVERLEAMIKNVSEYELTEEEYVREMGKMKDAARTIRNVVGVAKDAAVGTGKGYAKSIAALAKDPKKLAKPKQVYKRAKGYAALSRAKEVGKGFLKRTGFNKD